MKEILVLSGKGGTGKTSFTSSFVYLTPACIVCDYDVDASNLPLLLNPKRLSASAFSSSDMAHIDPDLCIQCGICAELCRFGAILDFQVQALACEGCAFCLHLCPVDAVSMHPRSSGNYYTGLTGMQQPMFYADLRPGEENSGLLVAAVKKEAWAQAREDGTLLIIADGPPGIGCAAISSLVGVSLVVLVAEPSVSGFHDLQRAYELVQSRSIKAVLIINKSDLFEEMTAAMEAWARENEIPVAGTLPFCTALADSIAQGTVPAARKEVAVLIQPIWDKVLQQI